MLAGRYFDFNAFTELMAAVLSGFVVLTLLALTGRLRLTLALLAGVFAVTLVYCHLYLDVLLCCCF
jgi:hypothetical protein